MHWPRFRLTKRKFQRLQSKWVDRQLAHIKELFKQALILSTCEWWASRLILKISSRNIKKLSRNKRQRRSESLVKVCHRVREEIKFSKRQRASPINVRWRFYRSIWASKPIVWWASVVFKAQITLEFLQQISAMTTMVWACRWSKSKIKGISR